MASLPLMFLGLFGLPLLAGVGAMWRSRRRIQALRASGVYPQEGCESEADVKRLKGAGETVLAVCCYRAVHHVSLAEAHAAILGRQTKRGLPAIFFLALLLMIIAYAASRR